MLAPRTKLMFSSLRLSFSLLLKEAHTLHYIRGFVITTGSVYHWVVFQYQHLMSSLARRPFAVGSFLALSGWGSPSPLWLLRGS